MSLAIPGYRLLLYARSVRVRSRTQPCPTGYSIYVVRSRADAARSEELRGGSWPGRQLAGRPQRLARLCRSPHRTRLGFALCDAGDEIVGSLKSMRYSVYNHVNRAKELRRGTKLQIPPDPTLQSSAILRAESNGFDACGYDPTRGRGASRSVGPQRSLLLSIHAEASSARRNWHGGLSPLFPTPISYRSPCLSPISHALTSVT